MYQSPENIMYCDIILTFDCFVEQLNCSQAFIESHQPILGNASEEEMIYQLFESLNFFMDEHALPKEKLWKISTACNWSLFKKLTKSETPYLNRNNGKWCFNPLINPANTIEEAMCKRYGWGKYFSEEKIDLKEIIGIQAGVLEDE